MHVRSDEESIDIFRHIVHILFGKPSNNNIRCMPQPIQLILEKNLYRIKCNLLILTMACYCHLFFLFHFII